MTLYWDGAEASDMRLPCWNTDSWLISSVTGGEAPTRRCAAEGDAARVAPATGDDMGLNAVSAAAEDVVEVWKECVDAGKSVEADPAPIVGDSEIHGDGSDAGAYSAGSALNLTLREVPDRWRGNESSGEGHAGMRAAEDEGRGFGGLPPAGPAEGAPVACTCCRTAGS